MGGQHLNPAKFSVVSHGVEAEAVAVGVGEVVDGGFDVFERTDGDTWRRQAVTLGGGICDSEAGDGGGRGDATGPAVSWS